MNFDMSWACMPLAVMHHVITPCMNQVSHAPTNFTLNLIRPLEAVSNAWNTCLGMGHMPKLYMYPDSLHLHAYQGRVFIIFWGASGPTSRSSCRHSLTIDPRLWGPAGIQLSWPPERRRGLSNQKLMKLLYFKKLMKLSYTVHDSAAGLQQNPSSSTRAGLRVATSCPKDHAHCGAQVSPFHL